MTVTLTQFIVWLIIAAVVMQSPQNGPEIVVRRVASPSSQSTYQTQIRLLRMYLAEGDARRVVFWAPSS